MHRSTDDFFWMLPDEKSTIGAALCLDQTMQFDYFYGKPPDSGLLAPISFAIDGGKFPGEIADYQPNNLGFLLFSPRLRDTIDPFLAMPDAPRWFPAKIRDLSGQWHSYAILFFFLFPDLIDPECSTYIDAERTHLIKERYSAAKIGDRKVFPRNRFTCAPLAVHKSVRAAVKLAGCSKLYFYRIHTPGRLSE